jgi:CRP/FNR family transcriptional regulator, cyclic AMP receptor protein
MGTIDVGNIHQGLEEASQDRPRQRKGAQPETLERILRVHPFLSSCPERCVGTMVGCASQVRFGAGDLIFEIGQEASSFFLIRRGLVALGFPRFPGESITVETIGDGDLLGWSGLVPPHRWGLNAQAVDTTLALKFDARCLRRKCETDHDLGYELYKLFTPVVAERLQAVRLQALDMYGIPLRPR